jgi:hypothetical protein
MQCSVLGLSEAWRLAAPKGAWMGGDERGLQVAAISTPTRQKSDIKLQPINPKKPALHCLLYL